MKTVVLLMVCFSISTVTLRAQTIKTVTVDQLEKRFSQGKDTLYVVNFWATWCAPCVAELPYFEKLQADHKNSAVKVLLVSMDFESQLKSAVIPFVKKKQLASEVLLASRKSDQEFINRVDNDWSGSLPGTLVVNPEKKFRKFYEKPFTSAELITLYEDHKN
jgi:thiol-disulfide isomerase/thioredoxin